MLAAVVFADEAALGDHVEIDERALRWSGRDAGPDELERARREGLVAIGSCSFSEPVDDLRGLGVL